MARDYLKTISEHVVIYDGGMGATLEQFDLTSEDYGGLAGKCHEALVLNRPDVIEGVHASMLEAGAEVLETDTFQGSRIKLDEWGLADYTVEINTKAAEIARKAAGEERFVAGSIGPTGYLPASEDPSLGQIRFSELVEVFAEQAAGLIDGGADLLIIETAQDIRSDRLPAGLRGPLARADPLLRARRGVRRAGGGPDRRRRGPLDHRDRPGHQIGPATCRPPRTPRSGRSASQSSSRCSPSRRRA